MGISQEIVNAIKMVLTNTTAVVNGEIIPIKIGTPQGSCLSPRLFTLFINDLLSLLSSDQKHFKAEAFAFADDICIVTNGIISVHHCITKLKRWCQENEM